MNIIHPVMYTIFFAAVTAALIFFRNQLIKDRAAHTGQDHVKGTACFKLSGFLPFLAYCLLFGYFLYAVYNMIQYPLLLHSYIILFLPVALLCNMLRYPITIGSEGILINTTFHPRALISKIELINKNNRQLCRIELKKRPLPLKWSVPHGKVLWCCCAENEPLSRIIEDYKQTE